MADYAILRERLKSFTVLGAMMPTDVNVVSGDGWSEGEAG